MVMAFFREDPIFPVEPAGSPSMRPSGGAGFERPVPVIRAKLRVPDPGDAMPRPWLSGILEKSSKNSAATAVVGRAGTGKTAIAAEFVRGRADVSWYTLDALDADWRTFQSYFRLAVFRDGPAPQRAADPIARDCGSPLEMLADVAAGLEVRGRQWPSLLVLDGIHHLFDRPWFGDLLEHLVASTPAHSHALFLSRSQPPTPIWRMRSKQLLNVIDEKLLAFSPAETEELFARLGVRDVSIEAALAASFGHAGVLREIVRSRTPLAA